MRQRAGAFDASPRPMVGRSPPSFRTSMLALFAALSSVAIVATIALIGLIAALSRGAAEVAAADARMQASARTKVALLWYARESDVADLQQSPEALALRSAAEAELRADVDETRRLATPDRVAQLDNLVRKSATYVSLRDSLQQQGLPLEVILRHATPDLEAALVDLTQLVNADEASSQTVRESSQRRRSTVVILAACAAALLLMGFGAAFIGARVLLWRPIAALSDAIARFAHGCETSRASEQRGSREVRQIAVTFNGLADRLASHEKERLEFLASVAHDLRNPLTPMKLAISRLRAGPPSPETSAKVLGVVDKQVERLDRMVGDLLDATRIESGELELKTRTLDLRTLVTGVADLYRPASAAHAIEVVAPDEPVMVTADPLRIEQVVINLVSNAIKYSPGGGRVTIRVSAAAEQDVIAVTDEGIGVPPEEQERIFQPFHRTGRSREAVPGVGLGLAVARKIAKAHGGGLDVESSGHGSTFRLTLPTGDHHSAPHH